MALQNLTPVDPLVGVVFKKGEDFVYAFVGEGELFPAGTTARLEIYTSTKLDVILYNFPATVTSNSLRWRVESEVADTIPRGKQLRFFVRYPGTPTTDVRMLKGVTIRDD